VQTCLTCCLGVQVVYNFIACAAQASREQMCQMRTTHAQTISPIWSRRVSSFFYGSYLRFREYFLFVQSTHTTASHKHKQRTKQTQTQTDRRTDRQTDGQTAGQTDTWEAGVRHVGHIFVVLIMREAQLLHTHRCPHGVNKCVCMLAHH
jgi:hypothetical protein